MKSIPNETQPSNEEVLNENSAISRSAESISKAPPVQPPLSGKSSWVRLFALPTSVRWGLIVVALLFLIAGSLFIYWALKPRPYPVNYQGTQGTIEGFWSSVTEGNTSNPQTVFLLGNNQYYFFHKEDFTGASPTPFDTYDVHTHVSLIYQPDQTIQFTAPGMGNWQGTAYHVMQITFYYDNGQTAVFTTDWYAQRYADTTRANWSIGIVLVLIGVVIATFAFTAPYIQRRLTRRNTSR